MIFVRPSHLFHLLSCFSNNAITGQDASFAYIKSVEMCASQLISQKKIGYLTASLFLSPEHEFRFMLVNQIQRDMASTNLLETSTALSAVCKLVTVDMVPAVMGEVLKLLQHDSELIRKKCVCALHRLYQMDNDCLTDHLDKIKRTLCDKDPSVMGASLVLLYTLIKENPNAYKDLVASFVSILKQIIEHRLPREYDYHRIPAPWIQMQLLKILAILGKGDQAASEGVYEVLVEVMRRADVGINVGYAIVYEAVRTVTTIYPNPMLLDAAATSISRFIRSDSHNLKYIGIKGLASIVKDHPRYAADHQMAVIDCLEDPDETLKRKTLDLLLKMTNSVNVEFIVAKLLSFLATTNDDHFRGDLVGRITQCAERYAPSNTWYVETMVRVFEVAGEKVKMSVAQTLMQLIAEGAEEEEGEEEEDANSNGLSKDDEVRLNAVENFLILLEKPKLPDILAQTVSWVLGEYGYLSQECSKEEVMDKLRLLALHSNDSATKAHIVTALMKLCAQAGGCPPSVHTLITDYAKNKSLDVQQRCIEFLTLVKTSDIMVDALPVDASCEDIDVDENLSFLSGYVQAALDRGAVPYTPPANQDDDDDDETPISNILKFNPYERQMAPPPPLTVESVGGSSGVMDINTMSAMLGQTSLSPAPSAKDTGNQLLSSSKIGGSSGGPWGKKIEAPPPPPTPEPVVEAAVVSPQPVAVETPKMEETSASVDDTPTAPRELTDKEKMAAALFGGVGTKSTSSSRRRSTTTANRSSPVPSQTNSSGGLLDMGSTPPPTTAAPSSSSSNNALFDMMNVSTAPAVATAMTPTTDLLGSPLPSMAAPGPAPSSVPVAMTISPTPLADVFGDMSVLTPTSTVASGSFAQSTVASGVENTGNFSPLRMSTPDFGGKWGSLLHENKQNGIPVIAKTLFEIQQVMPSFVGHVESIPATSEAIFASSGGDDNSGVALLHLKLNPSRGVCDIIVKGTSRDLANKLLSATSKGLTSS